MTTLITGASGFVGLALVEHLLARGESVAGYDLAAPSVQALAAFRSLPGRFAMETGDVRDAQALRGAMRRHGASRLVTLAAITAGPSRERSMPQEIVEVNIGGVLEALAAAADCGVRRVLHASSGAVYGASGNGPDSLHEDRTALRPEGLYGISKQAAEAAALRFAGLAGLDLVVGRLGTCFGPWEADSGARDTPSAPLQVLRLARRGEPVVLPRAGKRDWLYVRDAAAAMAVLLDQADCRHSTYNLAAGFNWSISDWCQQLTGWDPGFRWRLAGPGDRPNVDYYAPCDRAPMDTGRLRADTGFAPRYDLAAAAEDFHDWLDHG